MIEKKIDLINVTLIMNSTLCDIFSKLLDAVNYNCCSSLNLLKVIIAKNIKCGSVLY